jgi:hypothetical protein
MGFRKSIFKLFKRAKSDDDMRAAIDAANQHEKDLLVECPFKGCAAERFAECTGEGVDNKTVHFSRRLKRMLAGIR